MGSIRRSFFLLLSLGCLCGSANAESFYSTTCAITRNENGVSAAAQISAGRYGFFQLSGDAVFSFFDENNSALQGQTIRLASRLVGANTSYQISISSGIPEAATSCAINIGRLLGMRSRMGQVSFNTRCDLNGSSYKIYLSPDSSGVAMSGRGSLQTLFMNAQGTILARYGFRPYAQRIYQNNWNLVDYGNVNIAGATSCVSTTNNAMAADPGRVSFDCVLRNHFAYLTIRNAAPLRVNIGGQAHVRLLGSQGQISSSYTNVNTSVNPGSNTEVYLAEDSQKLATSCEINEAELSRLIE